MPTVHVLDKTSLDRLNAGEPVAFRVLQAIVILVPPEWTAPPDEPDDERPTYICPVRSCQKVCFSGHGLSKHMRVLHNRAYRGKKWGVKWINLGGYRRRYRKEGYRCTECGVVYKLPGEKSGCSKKHRKARSLSGTRIALETLVRKGV